MSSHSGVCVFVYAYVSIFAVAGFLLYGPAFVEKDEESADEGRKQPPGRPPSAPRLDFVDTEGSLTRAEYLGRRSKVPGWRPGSANIECSSLTSASDVEFVGGGWTKAVYRAKVVGREVAIKTVNLDGRDVRECRRAGGSLAACYRRAATKILREAALLSRLSHENVLQVLGSCMPDPMGRVAMVTEFGDPLDTVKLLQLSWEDRLKLALGVARILHRLAHSPLGSLAMNDFRRQQFVLVDGSTLKLSDVDDVGVSEPPCTSGEECLRHLPAEMANDSVSHHCLGGRCVGHNERINVWRAGRHFIQLFLPISTPSPFEPRIQEILEAYRHAIWNSDQILDATERLVASFISEENRDRQPQHSSLLTTH